MEQTSNSFKLGKNITGLILLWAFAESGIGGILHALKLPFTGIFVGGIAVIVIPLIAYYTASNKSILKALFIVLVVKLTVSPHSPWQAYVAVIFQGYLGYLFFRTVDNFRIKCMIYSVLCLAESAIQKILLSLLIYGLQMMEAIDAAGLAIAKILHLPIGGSLTLFIFFIYFIVHLITGIVLGRWIPFIPQQIDTVKSTLPSIDEEINIVNSRKSIFQSIIISTLVLIFILVCIKWLVPTLPIYQLLWIVIRSIVVTVVLMLVIGPIFKWAIWKWSKTKSSSNHDLHIVLNNIPSFTKRAAALIQVSNKSFRGIAKVKYIVLGLLILSLQYNSNE